MKLTFSCLLVWLLGFMFTVGMLLAYTGDPCKRLRLGRERYTAILVMTWPMELGYVVGAVAQDMSRPCYPEGVP